MIWGICVATANSLMEITSILFLVEAMGAERYEKKRTVRLIVYILLSGFTIAANINEMNKFLFLLCYPLFFLLVFYESRQRKVLTLICLCIGILLVSIIELIAYIPIGIITNFFELKIDLSFLAVFLALLACYIIRKKEILLLIQHWLKEMGKKLYIEIFVASIMIGIPLIFSKFNMGFSFTEGTYLILMLSVLLIAMYKIEVYRKELSIKNNYEGKYTETIELIRARQHKFMNQLDSIYLLFELYSDYDKLVEKQKESLGQLKEYLLPNKILILERPVVVTHIYSKMCEAEDRGIILHTDFSCSLHEISIPDIMLIEITGNLLDNAMDEVAERGQDERIYFNIYKEEAWSVLEVCNEHSVIPYEEYRRFFEQGYSNKGEKRGTGLPYVKKIVNKYAGKLEVGNVRIFDANCFSIKVFVK